MGLSQNATYNYLAKANIDFAIYNPPAKAGGNTKNNN
jgi:hypothetical protein